MAKFCMSCGNRLDDNAAFCTKCGSPQGYVNYNQNYNQGYNNYNQGNYSYNNQQVNRTNGYALTGFILSFFFLMIALIFSIIGYSQSKEMNGEGKGLAIAGITICSVRIAIVIFLLALAYTIE